MSKVNTEDFKPRCSSLEKIMGEIGLSATQQKKLDGLQLRADGEGKPLTDKMEAERVDLAHKRDNPILPTGCTTYLKEWYAEEKYGGRQDIQSKYTAKGHMCEDEAIGVIDDMFGEFGERMTKNEERRDNGWLTGEADVVSKIIYDAKCPWDGKTFLDSVYSPHNTLYIWQMRGYMFLWDKPEAKVCYVLLDTPEDANYGEEVIFSDMSIEDRFYSFSVFRDEKIEQQIKERVLLCRKWLGEYDAKVCDMLGRNI